MTTNDGFQTSPVINQAEKALFRILTPEGVPILLEIALAGDRLVAFIIDFSIIMLSVILVWALAVITEMMESIAVAMMVSFVLRNFYFMFFEQRWQGSTPGKRNRKLRVVDVNGGQLTIEAVIVRNLTRDIEIFIPLAVLSAPQVIWPNAPAFAAPIAGLWMVLLGMMPLFNKHRRRIGDLIAGTMVIAAPQVELLGDLAVTGDKSVFENKKGEMLFTNVHLSFYGIYELQVLENVLRMAGHQGAEEKMSIVRKKVVAKIGWEKEIDNDHAFLKSFYAAQRAHLEGKMLMGNRREDKFADIAPTVEKDQ